jgi:hypothetical protein
MPIGCDDDALPWARKAENPLDTKYPYVCHAEMNAILNKNSADVKGCTMYVPNSVFFLVSVMSLFSLATSARN